ncbi:MAG: nitrate ABC transporter permease [Polycyclovorans sp.]|nr:nitrate ABC transporter permease [Polycyclovorans sp.]|tara:strand:- start:2158 stop:3165 length:1008 start_codon:yes stop_codon:yes gene_type:complete
MSTGVASRLQGTGQHLVARVAALRGSDARSVLKRVALPMIGLLVMLMLWEQGAKQVQTSLGALPGPVAVWEQAGNLWDEHRAERAKAAAFYQRQDERNAERLAKNPEAEVRIRSYTGKPTFVDQIKTSLVTVMSGFLLASLIAIPAGLAIGLSPTLYAMFNPVIQLFKPVSPLAWLPIVTLVVSAVYVSDDPMISKSYLVSMLCVMLCSIWPTLVNTAVGASTVSTDLVSVSRVLRLHALSHVWRVVLPSAIPMIFAGLRTSLGVAWMVLIASEMLAQNPGLGKFVWDEFQNGSSASLGRIMVAVLTIGLIGFLLDRCMLWLQRNVSWDKNAILR